MSQPSVAQYFTTRKRSAIDDHKIDRARKVLILSQEVSQQPEKDAATLVINRIKERNVIGGNHNEHKLKKRTTQKLKDASNSGYDIKNFLNAKVTERCVTPTNQSDPSGEKNLTNITKKICKSDKLNELKASINRFKESAQHLKTVEKKTSAISHSPKLKTFQSIEFEVSVSPQKLHSPEKQYLSPKKESTVRRNLLNSLSPVKSSPVKSTSLNYEQVLIEEGTKPSLQVPVKYKTLNEMFRATDTVAQILYNRKELITFKKLQPAIEEMVKRTFLQRHVAQLKAVYPEAYSYAIEKIKLFGQRMQEQWDLVLTPNIGNVDGITPQVLLDRRRKFTELLIERVKKYHNEFLLSLTPPMIIKSEDITRWHPEFDLEKIPDIEVADLPQIPIDGKYSSGKEVLEKARQLFNCNTRMEQALNRINEIRRTVPSKEIEQNAQPNSILKGIPKALLEKVRQKQAAKALMSMTRTAQKEKEVQMYSRLSELARITRSVFVTEKKSVLELDVVVNKLGNSYRCFLSKGEIEDHLKAISKEVPEWLIFHTLRNSVFLKLAKNADLSIVVKKLENLAKQKNEA